MALSDVLNNLTGARDALVSAINGKGGSVSASATLRQCAEAVTALPEGGGGGGSSLLQGVAFYSSLTDVETSETADKMNTTGTVSATIVGNVTSGNFNGSSYLTVETYKKLPKFCVCAWINFNENCNGGIIASQDLHFRIFLLNGAQVETTSYSYDDNTQGAPEGRMNADVNANSWYNVIYKFDGQTYFLYIDGSLISSTEKTRDGFVPYFDGLRIGWHNSAFNGNISDVVVYNRVLTDEEIAELYSLGPGGFEKIWFTKKSNEGILFFTTTEANGKPYGGYMFAGTGTLKLQLATGEITELSLTDTNQRAFSSYELSNVRVVSGSESVTWLSINGIGIDYIDLSNFRSLEHLHMPISSSPEIKNLSECHRLNYVDVGNSALSSAQVDQLLADILASNSHLNYESFSGSIDVSQNAVPTAEGLETIAQLESVGWSVNYDRE